MNEQQQSVQNMIVDVRYLESISYAINCLDQMSGAHGTFAYDEVRWQMGLGHYAISPVFKSVEGFYAWAKASGFHYHKINHLFCLTRSFE